jgi:hypothetical protein
MDEEAAAIGEPLADLAGDVSTGKHRLGDHAAHPLRPDLGKRLHQVLLEELPALLVVGPDQSLALNTSLRKLAKLGSKSGPGQVLGEVVAANLRVADEVVLVGLAGHEHIESSLALHGL